MESLAGHFLIATSQMPDPRFRQSLIFLCSHTDEGAMGMIINRPSPHNIADLLASADINIPTSPLPQIYFGGPVEEDVAFFLYSSEYAAANFIEVSKTICLSRDPEILYDIAQDKGPARYLFLLGYAGWAPGQLEEELRYDGWLSFPADDGIIFSTPDSLKWEMAAMRNGVDISLYSDILGTA